MNLPDEEDRDSVQTDEDPGTFLTGVGDQGVENQNSINVQSQSRPVTQAESESLQPLLITPPANYLGPYRETYRGNYAFAYPPFVHLGLAPGVSSPLRKLRHVPGTSSRNTITGRRDRTSSYSSGSVTQRLDSRAARTERVALESSSRQIRGSTPRLRLKTPGVGYFKACEPTNNEVDLFNQLIDDFAFNPHHPTLSALGLLSNARMSYVTTQVEKRIVQRKIEARMEAEGQRDLGQKSTDGDRFMTIKSSLEKMMSEDRSCGQYIGTSLVENIFTRTPIKNGGSAFMEYTAPAWSKNIRFEIDSTGKVDIKISTAEMYLFAKDKHFMWRSPPVTAKHRFVTITQDEANFVAPGTYFVSITAFSDTLVQIKATSQGKDKTKEKKDVQDFKQINTRKEIDAKIVALKNDPSALRELQHRVSAHTAKKEAVLLASRHKHKHVIEANLMAGRNTPNTVRRKIVRRSEAHAQHIKDVQLARKEMEETRVATILSQAKRNAVKEANAAARAEAVLHARQSRGQRSEKQQQGLLLLIAAASRFNWWIQTVHDGRKRRFRLKSLNEAATKIQIWVRKILPRIRARYVDGCIQSLQSFLGMSLAARRAVSRLDASRVVMSFLLQQAGEGNPLQQAGRTLLDRVRECQRIVRHRFSTRAARVLCWDIQWTKRKKAQGVKPLPRGICLSVLHDLYKRKAKENQILIPLYVSSMKKWKEHRDQEQYLDLVILDYEPPDRPRPRRPLVKMILTTEDMDLCTQQAMQRLSKRHAKRQAMKIARINASKIPIGKRRLDAADSFEAKTVAHVYSPSKRRLPRSGREYAVLITRKKTQFSDLLAQSLAEMDQKLKNEEHKSHANMLEEQGKFLAPVRDMRKGATHHSRLPSLSPVHERSEVLRDDVSVGSEF